MGKNVKGSTTVAAVQQAHAVNAQTAKNVATPKQQQAAKPQSKPATPAQKSAAPISFAAAAAAAKPRAAPQGQKVQAAPPKFQAAPKPPTPQQKQNAQAAPMKPQAVKRGASAKKLYDMGPGYENFYIPSLFLEPASWTRNQAPCHAPHVAAKPVAKQLNKAVGPVNKPSTPVPKAQANNKGSKSAPVAATKAKKAINWNSPAGKQLILRPKNELVLYRPMWIQIHHWAQFGTTSPLKDQPQRGRSAGKANKSQRMQQQKQRVQNERNPNDRPKPKSQHNKPLSRQTSSIAPSSPALSRQASSISPKSPNLLSRQNSHIQKSAPLPLPRQQSNKKGKKSHSSSVDYNQNAWENFYSPKPQLARQQNASARSIKSNAVPYMNLKAGMPREMIHRDAEGSNFQNFKLEQDGAQRGVQMGPQPKQQGNKGQQRAVNNSRPQTPQQKKNKQSSGGGWLTTSGIAVASAIVAIGSVGLSKLMNN